MLIYHIPETKFDFVQYDTMHTASSTSSSTRRISTISIALLVLGLLSGARGQNQSSGCDPKTIRETRTMADGSTAYLCGSEIWKGNVRLASFTDGTNFEPGLHKLATGWLCDVIYREHGASCYNNVIYDVASNFFPRTGSTQAELDQRFLPQSSTRFDGQNGVCWSTMSYFVVSGLTPAATALARDYRAAQIDNCYWETFETRTFMTGLWVGIQAIGILIFVVLMTIVAVPSIMAYLVFIGLLCAKKSSSSSS